MMLVMVCLYTFVIVFLFFFFFPFSTSSLLLSKEFPGITNPSQGDSQAYITQNCIVTCVALFIPTGD